MSFHFRIISIFLSKFYEKADLTSSPDHRYIQAKYTTENLKKQIQCLQDCCKKPILNKTIIIIIIKPICSFLMHKTYRD